jgi:hypothetical protein
MAGRRPADWRFPTPKQQKAEDTAKKIAEAQRRREVVDDKESWWAAVLSDPRAVTSAPVPTRTLGEIQSDLLRVACKRCGRAVEIRRDDAIARFGADAKWRQVGQRLLNEGCEVRTGQYEVDGCWPDFTS